MALFRNKLNSIICVSVLGLSALLAPMAQANTAKVFTKEEQAELMAKGMWYDERTGLIWSRCSLGQTWTGTTCTEGKSYTFNTAIEQTKKYQLGGYNDWQIPTIAQLKTIIKCNNGYKSIRIIPINNNNNIEIAHECKENPVNGVSRIDSNIFKSNMVSYWHLSSTPTLKNTYYTVSFYYGAVGDHHENLYSVRPVRVAINESDTKILNLINNEVNTYKTKDAKKYEEQSLKAKMENKNQAEKAKTEAEARELAKQKQAQFMASLQVCKPVTWKQSTGITEENFGTCDKIGTDEFVGLSLLKQNGRYFDITCHNGSKYDYDSTAKRLINKFTEDSCWKALPLIPNYCELDNYRGQCNAQKQPHGVGYQRRVYGKDWTTYYEMYKGMFKDGERLGYGSQYTLTGCGVLGCAGYEKSGGGYFKGLEQQYTCERDLKNCETKPARQAEQARKEEEAYNRKATTFRKNLKVGDDASVGMVVEIKGDLVKIQTNDRQCSQRDYNGKCTNYINTPVEKWFKRRELHPAD